MEFLTKVFVLFTVTSSILCFLSCPDPEENTNDPFAFVEDNLTLCCNVTGSPDDVTLYQANVSVPIEKAWRLEGSGVGITCMQWVVPAPTAVHHYCVGLSGESKHSCLGYQFVRTDDSPTSIITHLSETECLLEVGNFSFSFPDVRNRFSFPQHASFAVRFSSSHGADKACNVTCKKGTCTCGLLLGKDVEMHIVTTFNVTLTYHVTNTGMLRETVSGVEAVSGASLTRSDNKVFSVIPKECAVGNFPKGLGMTVIAPNASCLLVNWTAITNNNLLVWRLTISPVNDGNASDTTEEFFEDPQKLSSRLACGLTSSTDFKVSLACRLNYSQVWSPRETRFTRTDLAPPTESPDLAPGYSVDGTNRAVFYWKGVSLKESPVKYVVTYVLRHAAHTRDTSQESNTTHVVFHNLDLSQEFEVRVRAVNRAGSGKDSPPLHLSGTYVSTARGVVEQETENNVMLKMLWPVTSFPVISFTLMWCRRGGRHHNVCEGDIEWVTVPYNATRHNRQLYVIRGRIGQIQYGVSVQFRIRNLTVSSGFQWSACMYTTAKDGTLQALYTLGCQQEVPSTIHLNFGPGSENDEWPEGENGVLYVKLTAVIGVVLVAVCCVTGCRKLVRQYRRKKSMFAAHYREVEKNQNDRHRSFLVQKSVLSFPTKCRPHDCSTFTFPDISSDPRPRHLSDKIQAEDSNLHADSHLIVQSHNETDTVSTVDSNSHLKSEGSIDKEVSSELNETLEDSADRGTSTDSSSGEKSDENEVDEYSLVLLDDVAFTQARYHEWPVASSQDTFGESTGSDHSVSQLIP